jgi:hypothetical protein
MCPYADLVVLAKSQREQGHQLIQTQRARQMHTLPIEATRLQGGEEPFNFPIFSVCATAFAAKLGETITKYSLLPREKRRKY